MNAVASVLTLPRTAPGRGRAVAEASAFVGVWMALSAVFPAPVGYLLVGVPLAAAFQVVVRRRPLRELWVRDGEPFRLDALGRRVAAAVMITPAVLCAGSLVRGDALGAAMFLAPVGGAVAAGYAFRSLRPGATGTALRWLAVSASVAVGGVLVGSLPPFLHAAGRPSWASALSTGVVHLLWLVPGMFVVEEVVFRGLLDTHLHRLGERRELLSAIYVSALWGVWHLPFADAAGLGDMPLPALVAGLVGWHCLIGVPLSFAWRRTGNLCVPALAHGLADAVRDALWL